MKREDFIARVRHIGWITYQIASGQSYNEESNDDQLKSLMNGIKFQDEHPNNTPERNHKNWMEMKISQGWKYGKVKNFENKTHPDLVPFNELPLIEQNKDIADSISHKMASKLWNQLMEE